MLSHFMDNDQTHANEIFDGLLNVIKTKDKNKLRSMFAKNAINLTSDFEAQIDALFEYYSGVFVSYNDWAGPSVEYSREDDEEIKIMYSTHDVDTGKEIYRIAIRRVDIDTSNPDNVGIWSLYIIKKEYNEDLDYAYRGDGKDTPGINIGI